MEIKKVSTLVPYMMKDDDIFVYLQRRDKDIKIRPDWFGFWGGSAENGEKPEATMKREVQEELEYKPRGYEYLGRYEYDISTNSVFILAVDVNFENQIRVREGQYGKWLTIQESLDHPLVIEEDKIVLRDLHKLLHTRKNQNYNKGA